jgi:hypothetical protein
MSSIAPSAADASPTPPSGSPIQGSRVAPASLVDTASVTTFGHLAWVGWVWLAAFVIASGAVVAVGAFSDGQLTDSLWQGLGAGWQRWILLAAGISTTATFAPMLVGNGVTRARLSASVTVTMVVLAVLGSVVVAAGYLLEGVVFSANDWSHVLDGGGRTLGARMIAGLAVRHALTFGAYFVSGWLIGIGFYRFGREGGVPLIVPSIVPVVLVELLLLGGGAGMLTSGPIGDLSGPPLAVGAPASALVIGLAALAATRYTRELALKQ